MIAIISQFFRKYSPPLEKSVHATDVFNT